VRDFALQVQAFTAAVNKLPAVQGMTTTFRANVPQVYLDVDRAAAKARGVSLTDLFSTLQTFLSTLYITTSTSTAGPTGCRRRRSSSSVGRRRTSPGCTCGGATTR
jgi:multidrug efflux pump subunit AcrB